jgi:hypothetical protein
MLLAKTRLSIRHASVNLVKRTRFDHVTRVFKVTAAFLLGLPVDFRCFAQCALPKGGTLKVGKLDRLPLLHIHRNQSKVRTTLHSIP